MKKDIVIFIKNKINEYKTRSKWKKIVSILFCFTVIITISFLLMPAHSLNEVKTYTLTLKDSYDYSWKEGFNTNFNLNLYFMDTDGNYIEGKDVTIDIGPNSLIDDPYSFGYVPINGETTRGEDLIKKLNLNEIVLTTGEKYVFDHAEVYTGNAWNAFTSTSNHWDIWCQYAGKSTTQTDYGWRGKYGDNVPYTVNDDTEYKFVYKLVRYGVSNSVPSLGSDSGISFKMFNYTGDNDETGINNNGLYNYFSFRDSSLTIPTYINKETDADGFTESRVKVLPNLENGYPVFNCQGYCENASLGYLFGASTNPKGETPVGVTSYTPVNTLLQKENIDGVEYYYYDSNRNATDYDIENNRFMLRDYLERGKTMYTYTPEILRYEFMPFNYFNNNRSIITIPDTSFSYNYEREEIDHWFGMTMEFSFYMPKNGTINGSDMIFSFSGDDDVWVFVDDVLVLDLGGTHGAVDGNINFKTGEVNAYLNWNSVTGTPNTTNIYEAYENANSLDKVAWNENNTTFKDYTLHTVKFFYLERGAAISNCKIRFNIPVLPSGSMSVQKRFNGIDEYNGNYEFMLYDVTSNVPASNTKYVIGDTEFYTDINGKFTLKTDEVATFILTNYHTYNVTETNAGNYAVSHSCTLNGTSCFSINQTPNFMIEPESTHQAVFTNEVKRFNLKVSKIAYGDSNDTFEFQINLKDRNGKIVEIPPNIISTNNYEINNENGVITYNLKNEESITINDIPINTNIILKETKHDGYNTIIKSGDIELSNTDTYEFILDSNKDITVHNIPGVSLPETGGSGIGIYLILGTILILISTKYLFNMKVGG